MNQTQIDQIVKRTQRAWYEDGLWELGFGVILGVLGLYYLLVGALNLEERLGLLLPLIQMVILLGIFWAVGRAIKSLKERLTFPRTGYVSFPRPTGSGRWRKALTAGLLAAFTGGAVAVITEVTVQNIMPMVVSIVLALVILYIGFRFGISRYLALALISIGFGIAASLMHLTSLISMAFLFVGIALLWLLSGGLTLASFLRRTQPADLADESIEDL